MNKDDHEHNWNFIILEDYKDGTDKVKTVWVCFDCLTLEYKPASEEELNEHYEWVKEEEKRQTIKGHARVKKRGNK